jgi:hypothetical protein
VPDDQHDLSEPGQPGVLNAGQRAALRSVANTLVPGAAEAGIVIFIERQLARENPLLYLKYRDLPLEPLAFYQGALDAIDRLAHRQYGQAFADLSEAERNGIVDLLIDGDPPGWDGPPATEVFTVLRMDAFDVVYATPAGYERLGVPLAFHIIPERG